MNSFRPFNLSFGQIFLISLAIAVLIYVLRGFGIITFIPGGVILISIGLCFISVVIWLIDISKRF